MTTRTPTGAPQPSHLAVALPDDEENAEHEDVTYDKFDKTKEIVVKNGYVTFTQSFRYLGSLISYNLYDNEDITARVAASTASMEALKEVGQNTHLNIYIKYLLFQAIPMNLLLWGCKTWLLQQSLLNKLKVFLHQSIRHILAINITGVKEERILNAKIRSIFYDIPDLEHMIVARQLDFMGKAIRGLHDRMMICMITACCNHQ